MTDASDHRDEITQEFEALLDSAQQLDARLAATPGIPVPRRLSEQILILTRELG